MLNIKYVFQIAPLRHNFKKFAIQFYFYVVHHIIIIIYIGEVSIKIKYVVRIFNPQKNLESVGYPELNTGYYEQELSHSFNKLLSMLCLWSTVQKSQLNRL